MKWTSNAEEAVKKIPFFVRKKAWSRVENETTKMKCSISSRTVSFSIRVTANKATGILLYIKTNSCLSRSSYVRIQTKN